MQIAAHDLGVPMNSVFIAETATDKVPNASPTAASASSDMYGGAIADACAQLNDRLAPYKAKAGADAAFAVRFCAQPTGTVGHAHRAVEAGARDRSTGSSSCQHSLDNHVLCACFRDTHCDGHLHRWLFHPSTLEIALLFRRWRWRRTWTAWTCPRTVST